MKLNMKWITLLTLAGFAIVKWKQSQGINSIPANTGSVTAGVRG